MHDFLVRNYLLPWQHSAQIYFVFLGEKLPEMLEEIPLILRRNVVPAWWGCGSLCTSGPRTSYCHLHWSLDRMGWVCGLAFHVNRPHTNGLFLWGQSKALIFMLPVDYEEDLKACIIQAAATWNFWVTHQSLLCVSVACVPRLVAVHLHIYSKFVRNTTFL